MGEHVSPDSLVVGEVYIVAGFYDRQGRVPSFSRRCSSAEIWHQAMMAPIGDGTFRTMSPTEKASDFSRIRVEQTIGRTPSLWCIDG